MTVKSAENREISVGSRALDGQAVGDGDGDGDGDADFRCSGCGHCCRMEGYVLLTAADINRLARWLEMDERAFVNRYARLTRSRSALSLIEQPNGSCVFYRPERSEGRCAVYPARPRQCRDFPTRWYVRGGCPVIEALNV